ncbi:MAG: hypothetical protein C0620_01955 [Desulfuromonas sp.]|nr:MAG: hypothetical protein C0620_01955 [Desulfuromonas sp.]
MKGPRGYVILLMSIFIAGIVIQQRYTQLKSDHLKIRESSQKVAYTSVTNTLRLVSRALADEVLQQEDILKLINDIVLNEGEQRNELRGQLYRKLYQMYARVSQHSIRQFHFHFPDGHSMLRFHAPHKADDDLIPYRPSIAIANREHIIVHGYETGRMVHGFRHVYPLNYHGSDIGTVEISNSFQQISSELSKITKATSTELLFIMYKPDLWYKLEPSQQLLYTPSILHPDYLCENAQATEFLDFGGTMQPSEYLHDIQINIRNRPQLKEKMTAGQEFALITRYSNQFYSVIFHSIKNTENKHAAYFIACTPEPDIQSLWVNALIQFAFISFLFILIFHYWRRSACFKTQQKSTEDFLQILSNNMGQGMYATDKQGRITFINAEADQVLGWQRDDVLGHDAHDLFHVDDNNHDQGCFILNSIIEGVTCRQEQAYFKNKRGEQFPVELTCTPIYTNEKVVGTITLFHDITQKLQDQMELLEAKTQLEEANRHLNKLARIDALTAIANRREFDETLSKLWKSSYRKKNHLALLIIDIDYFKRYNDFYGHQQGDLCLKQVAKNISKACMRPDDFVARYGGEEFVVLLPQTHDDEAIQVAEKIQERMKQAGMAHPDSPICSSVTLSIGICSVVPHDLTSEQHFIDCADRRLYVAKKRGRNQICHQD